MCLNVGSVSVYTLVTEVSIVIWNGMFEKVIDRGGLA